MTGQVFALLVGINAYPAPVNPLRGCRNDVEAMAAQLQARAGGPYHQQRLVDSEATRDGVIEAFRGHLGRAGKDDTAVFYYSGHGSREPAPEEFWAVEPDHQNETIVCVDSRTPGRHDLADKELAALVGGVAAGGAHVLVILDCCHSGSGVRGDDAAGQLVRQCEADIRPRHIDSYVAGAAGAGARAAGTGLLSPPGGGRYVLLAACEPAQTAKEQRIGDRQRGAFSASLEAALRCTGSQATYADLISWATTEVRDLAVAQTPQLEAPDPADARLGFLGGLAKPTGSYRLKHAAVGWTVDAGLVHGIPAPREGETTTFAVFPDDAADDRQVATVAVDRSEPDRSVVKIVQGQLEATARYRAVLKDWPVPPMPVELSGDAAGTALLRQALAPRDQAAEVVEAQPNDTTCELRVVATPERLEIRRVSDGRLVVEPVADPTDAGARRVVGQLEHIARWRRLRRLSNPGTSIPAGAVRLAVTDAATGSAGSRPGELALDYVDGHRPALLCSVTNTGDTRLYVALLGLSDRFGVRTLLTGTFGEWLEPGESAHGLGGRPVAMEVSQTLHDNGVTEVVDVIKVIAGTTSFSAEALQQGELDAPTSRKAADQLPPTTSALDRLVRRVGTRGFADTDESPVADWSTTSCTVRTRRPRNDVEVTPGGVEVGDGVTLHAPAGVVLRARIVDTEEVTRDVGGAPPTLLREGSSPVPLSRSREVGDDPMALELSWDTGAGAVSAATPVMVRLPEQLSADDVVVAFAFDGEFWLRVGGSVSHDPDSVQVAIDQLPAVAGAGTRDLKGSLKLLFRKVVGRRLGIDVKGTRLAVATVDGSGTVSYDEGAVAGRVGAAQKVLLYVHGIIGDTRGMVRHGAEHGLHEGYDVVLTFDYENITTPIRQTAALLGKALRDQAGFVAGDNRRLDVVAHSMGGLVARWYVEHEGGHGVVHRLVLAGSPQAGSPWPRIQDWATTALSFGLNSLAATGLWPAGVLGALVRLVERVDDALDDMVPNSAFLADLAALADPKVAYFVVAGDRSAAPDERTTSLLGRLRLKALNTVDAVAFLSTPNDIAVTVASASAVPESRTPALSVTRVGCDHMTYFSTDQAVAALRAALTGPVPS